MTPQAIAMLVDILIDLLPEHDKDCPVSIITNTLDAGDYPLRGDAECNCVTGEIREVIARFEQEAGQ